MAIDISKSAIHLFQSQDRLELLNDIDKFRQHGLANLPQIVVCGDTSSGKSSVLEALSGIPFPVDSTMCTRFATEIALRYSSDETITGLAFITPGPRSSEDHRACLRSFQKTVIAGLDAIPEILLEAQKVMGVGEAGGISRDVLHLRLSGRQLPNLTLVDLPGLIHSATNSDDIDNVQDLVKCYFRQKESLIMAIVSAENPIENQGILTLSRQFDPKGERTIGVITKPDILRRPDKTRLTPTVLELARNQHAAFKFKRQWQIMRCLTDDERQKGADRDRIETDLFLQDPWDGFDKKRLGTKSLRAVLCQYLEEHILHVLPELVKSLEEKIASAKLSLQELGPHRATQDERRQYLIRISRRYAQIVRDALNGDYSDSFFDKLDAGKRLRAKTMALTDDFEHAMRIRGHTFEIRGPLSHRDEPHRITIPDALVKVGKLLEGYRGPELPLLFNPRLVGELFKEQSQKWLKLTAEYTDAICHAVEVFLRKVIDSICPTTARVAELILREVFQDAIHDHQDKLNNKVLELFTPHTSAFLYSTKSRLEETLRAVQRDDYVWTVENEAASGGSASSGGGLGTASSDRDPRLTALQLSRAYYNVALETFVQNVVVLGVESCLLSKLEEMFSPETVAQMNEDKLQLLGGETPEMITERTDLTARLQTLETALKNCRRHASREFGLDLDRARAKSPILVSESLRSGSINDEKTVPSLPKPDSVNTIPVTGNATPGTLSRTQQEKLPTFNFAATPKPVPQLNQQVGSIKSGMPADDDKKSSPAPVSPVPQLKVSQPAAFKTPSDTVTADTSHSSKPLFGGFGGLTATQTSKPVARSPSTGSNVAPPSGIFGSTSAFVPGPPKSPQTVLLPGSSTDGSPFGAPVKQSPNSNNLFSFGTAASTGKPPSSGIGASSSGWPSGFGWGQASSLRNRLDHGPDDGIHRGSNWTEVLRCLVKYHSTYNRGVSFEELRLQDYGVIFGDEIRRFMASRFPDMKRVSYANYLEGVRREILYG
ncbi:uncharacterized protein Z520_04972 [Fonsecaea multimorphosa CBS 102226]|uniref:GED domain-containing protein n=1 Tax=Fonsecaea multimorphosa CBS 102226 TaxID=1442371 RepID=A0A0D2IQZ6_9EURO|nr:uncharacterized protein Z520_04972 [Fonsecaea multimorphosa CBS 102226]KIX99396.1 hypothetical protein Z520_04972 [Fonsecaea multimorphosa CBS 102226]